MKKHYKKFLRSGKESLPIVNYITIWDNRIQNEHKPIRNLRCLQKKDARDICVPRVYLLQMPTL